MLKLRSAELVQSSPNRVFRLDGSQPPRYAAPPGLSLFLTAFPWTHVPG